MLAALERTFDLDEFAFGKMAINFCDGYRLTTYALACGYVIFVLKKTQKFTNIAKYDLVFIFQAAVAETDYIFAMVIELADCALAFHVTGLTVNLFFRFATIVYEL